MRWCACTGGKVTQWEGDFEMREGQQMAWQQLPLHGAPGAGGRRCPCCSG